MTAIEPWWPAPDGPTKADLAVDGLRLETPARWTTGELESDWLVDWLFSGVDPDSVECRDIFGWAKGSLGVSLRVRFEEVSSSEESDSRLLNLCGVLQKNEMLTDCLFQFTFFFDVFFLKKTSFGLMMSDDITNSERWPVQAPVVSFDVVVDGLSHLTVRVPLL